MDGVPRALRLMSVDVSVEGMFIEMTKPLVAGSRVALALEAGEQVLPFAQGEVVWQREFSNVALGRRAGFAVKFTRFLHPRSKELLRYLTSTIGTGRPLQAAPTTSRRRSRWPLVATIAVLAVVTFTLAVTFRNPAREPPTRAVVVEREAELIETPVHEGAPIQAQPEEQPAAPVAPEHAVTLPSGAASALTWDGAHDEFRVAPALVPNATLSKVYLLADPPRLVFDIEGAAPVSSHSLASNERFFRRIRVGRQAGATRVVVDLAQAPKSFVDDGGAAIVSF